MRRKVKMPEEIVGDAAPFPEAESDYILALLSTDLRAAFAAMAAADADAEGEAEAPLPEPRKRKLG